VVSKPPRTSTYGMIQIEKYLHQLQLGPVLQRLYGDVNPVHQQAWNALLVACHLRWCAGAGTGRVPKIPARASGQFSMKAS